MASAHLPDDGLRCHQLGVRGTNHTYPCGHPRTGENRRPGSKGRCLLCSQRINRETKRRQRLRASIEASLAHRKQLRLAALPARQNDEWEARKLSLSKQRQRDPIRKGVGA